jgi:hypothetical protein
MVVVRKPGTKIELLVLEIPKLKFITLEMDADLFEFRILCMHNFENDRRLQKSGKINSRTGFL